jgi:hypothetical protein
VNECFALSDVTDQTIMSACPRGNPRVEPEEHCCKFWDPNQSYVDSRGAARQLAPYKGLHESKNSETLSFSDWRPMANSFGNSKNSSLLCGTAS